MKKKSTYVSTENTLQFAAESGEESLTVASISDECHYLLPAAGNRNGNDVNNTGNNGNYWSGSLNESNENNAWNLNFNNNGNNNWNNNNRNNGFQVRPVSELIANLPPGLKPYSISREQLLLDLWKAYKAARKHKRRTKNQIRFEMNCEGELVALRDSIFDGSYKQGTSTCFVISDPKKREIFASQFRDRVVHHLFFNYTNILFERTFIADSYSCRKGKGTLFGIKRLDHHIKSCSQSYVLPCFVMKLDIKGYFMNINRVRLLEICLNIFNDMALHRSNDGKQRWIEKVDFYLLFYLAQTIILYNPLDNCKVMGSKEDWKGLPHSKSLFHSNEGCGLPIGNLTSQLFSNVYMNVFDQYMKKINGCFHYGRYVDDAYVVDEKKSSLRRLVPCIREFLYSQLGLTLHPHKLLLVRAMYGVDFLGAFIKPHRIYLRNSSRRRMLKHLRETNKINDAVEVRARLNSYLGLLCHYSTFKFRNNLFLCDDHWKKWGHFVNGCSKFVLDGDLVVKRIYSLRSVGGHP